VRRPWLFALALTVLLPLLAVMLALSAVSASQAQCAGGLAEAGGPVGGVPTADIPIFQGAAAEFALGDRGPSILAAINYIESTFDTSALPGVHSGTNRAGAAGPMQIGIGGTAGDTWDTIKVNARADPPGQPPNVYDEADAVYSAAHYLQASGAPGDWPGATFTYNHSSAYVQQVLSLAAGYYTQGLTPQGSASSPTTTTSGAVTTGSTFPVPPASGDPAGPITLAQGQPMIVAATGLTDHTGAWGDDLTVSTDSYAELSPGIPRTQVTKQNATMLGGLPYLTPLQVTNPHNGRSLVLYKRDIGAGQPLSNTLDGYHYRIDLTNWSERQLGLTGSAIVQVTRVDGPTNGPGGGPACSSANVAPAQYANPFAHTRSLTPQRIDMGSTTTAKARSTPSATHTSPSPPPGSVAAGSAPPRPTAASSTNSTTDPTKANGCTSPKTSSQPSTPATPYAPASRSQPSHHPAEPAASRSAGHPAPAPRRQSRSRTAASRTAAAAPPGAPPRATT